MLKIRFLRKRLGFLQSEIERQLKIPHVLYSQIETGRLKNPFDVYKTKLESFYCLPWDKLITEVNADGIDSEMGKLNKKSVSRKGGTSTYLKYGREYMKKIGSMGGRRKNEIEATRKKESRKQGRRGKKDRNSTNITV